MAYYLVKAKIDRELSEELRTRLDSLEIRQMQPYGSSLHFSLENARIDPHGWIVWEEEDYCSPPLAQERAAVLDTYFTELSVEKVDSGEGWSKIDLLPELWQEEIGGSDAV